MFDPHTPSTWNKVHAALDNKKIMASLRRLCRSVDPEYLGDGQLIMEVKYFRVFFSSAGTGTTVTASAIRERMLAAYTTRPRMR